MSLAKQIAFDLAHASSLILGLAATLMLWQLNTSWPLLLLLCTSHLYLHESLRFQYTGLINKKPQDVLAVLLGAIASGLCAWLSYTFFSQYSIPLRLIAAYLPNQLPLVIATATAILSFGLFSAHIKKLLAWSHGVMLNRNYPSWSTMLALVLNTASTTFIAWQLGNPLIASAKSMLLQSIPWLMNYPALTSFTTLVSQVGLQTALVATANELLVFHMNRKTQTDLGSALNFSLNCLILMECLPAMHSSMMINLAMKTFFAGLLYRLFSDSHKFATQISQDALNAKQNDLQIHKSAHVLQENRVFLTLALLLSRSVWLYPLVAMTGLKLTWRYYQACKQPEQDDQVSSMNLDTDEEPDDSFDSNFGLASNDEECDGDHRCNPPK